MRPIHGATFARGKRDVSPDIKQPAAAGNEPSTTREPEPASGAIPKPVPGAVPMAKRGQIYTMTAQEGLDAAELVNAAFARKTIGKHTPRRLEVFAPDGPSTAGGKRARQTIRLVPLAGETGPVMCGFLDVAQKVVELRSYDTLMQQYEARFGVPCDITTDEYATLCRDLQMTLTPFRYSFTRESEQHAAAAANRAARLTSSERSADPNAERDRLLNRVLIGLLVVLAVAVAVMILR